jgi:hypothetical protein
LHISKQEAAKLPFSGPTALELQVVLLEMRCIKFAGIISNFKE